MTRQKKEIIRQINEIYAFIGADTQLGCGFAPAGFYDELEEEAMALEEQLAHLRGYRDILEMYTDYRGMRGCEDLPFV